MISPILNKKTARKTLFFEFYCSSCDEAEYLAVSHQRYERFLILVFFQLAEDEFSNSLIRDKKLRRDTSPQPSPKEREFLDSLDKQSLK